MILRVLVGLGLVAAAFYVGREMIRHTPSVREALPPPEANPEKHSLEDEQFPEEPEDR